MPIIKSAIKKLRKDRKREAENHARKVALDRAIRQAKKTPSKINEAFSAIDKAVKRNIIHKNKAARLKASLSKLAKPKTSRKSPPLSRSRSQPGSLAPAGTRAQSAPKKPRSTKK